MRLRERGDHRRGVQLKQIGKDGSTSKEALLARKDPAGEVALPAVAGSGGDNAVIAIDNTQWPCVVECVRFCAVSGDSCAFFGEAN